MRTSPLRRIRILLCGRLKKKGKSKRRLKERLARKPSAKSVRRPKEKPARKPSAKSVRRPKEKPARKPSAKSVRRLKEKPARKPSARPKSGMPCVLMGSRQQELQEAVQIGMLLLVVAAMTVMPDEYVLA